MKTNVNMTNVPNTTDQQTNSSSSVQPTKFESSKNSRSIAPSNEGRSSGSTLIPQIPSKLTHLIRDGGFLSATEWKIDHTELAPTHTTLYGIGEQSLCRAEIRIDEPFSTTEFAPELSITLPNGTTVMDSKWNQPNEVGTYTTECAHEIVDASSGLILEHNLQGSASGSMTVRVYGYRI